MRLIDKDLILKTAKDKEWGLWCEIVNIKFAPEVKAIPVEWLKAKAEKWASRNDVLMWGQCVKLLIEDWEKENGNDKT